MLIRGGSGLGDSIYLRPVVDHLEASGKQVTVMSNFPEVFSGTMATVVPVNKAKPVEMIAHYTTARFNQQSTQWQDILRSAKLPAELPLRFDWQVKNRELVDEISRQAKGAPIVIVHGGRAPFGRLDGYGKSIMPRQEAFAEVLKVFDHCLTVRIGKGEQYALPVKMDLSNRTSVSDMLDIMCICGGVVTQCGFPIPMAECFDKPVLAVWSGQGLRARDAVIASITPAKVLCKGVEHFVVDEWPTEKRGMVAYEYLRQIVREPACAL